MLEYYTDGSCLGNGKTENTGGYAIVAVDADTDTIAYVKQFREINTTNNRMELSAILWVMKHYGNASVAPPIVYSDSAYCVNTFNEWMFNWAKNGWKKSNNKIPENIDIIHHFYRLYEEGYRIDLRKIKGHSNNKYNELADKLATFSITEEEVVKNAN